MKQLVYGVPTTGILSQNGVRPDNTRAKLGILRHGHLFGSACERFIKGIARRFRTGIPDFGRRHARNMIRVGSRNLFLLASRAQR